MHSYLNTYLNLQGDNQIKRHSNVQLNEDTLNVPTDEKIYTTQKGKKDEVGSKARQMDVKQIKENTSVTILQKEELRHLL